MYAQKLVLVCLAGVASVMAAPMACRAAPPAPTRTAGVTAPEDVGGCGTATITEYTVKSGDTLTTIAAQFNSGICNIAALNGISNPNFITVGQELKIPQDCAQPDNTSCLPPAPPSDQTCIVGGPSTYTVKSGDTLSAIATNFGLTLDALEAANPQITNPDVIEVGQVINLPVCPNTSCQYGPYTIQSGDTFYDLAAKYNTSVGQLEAANPGVDPNALQVGQVIQVPESCVA